MATSKQSARNTVKDKVSLALFIILLGNFSYVNQLPNDNEDSRLNALYALRYEQTLSIDTYHNNTEDKAYFNGHYYSEKAPGTLVLAIPAFLLTTTLSDLFGISPESANGWLIIKWLTTIGSAGLITVLGGVFFYKTTKKYLQEKNAFLLTLFLFLGSLPFSYATTLFSHAITIALLCTSIYLLDKKDLDMRNICLAGLLSGLAISGEYSAGILIFFAMPWLVWKYDWKKTSCFAAALLPGLSLIAINNQLVTGSFLTLPYSSVSDKFTEMNGGLLGFHLPDLAHLMQLLFSDYRGLYFWSPILLLSFAGYRRFWRTSPQLLVLTAVIPLFYSLIISGYSYWWGGAALGPRHLAAALPLIAIAVAAGYKSYPRFGFTLGLVSVFLTGSATVISILAPSKKYHPIGDYYWPSVLNNHGAVTPVTVLSGSSVLSLVIWYTAIAIVFILSLRHFSGLKSKIQAK